MAVHRLSIDEPSSEFSVAVQKWLERPSPETVRAGRPSQIEERGHQVEVLHRLPNASSGALAGSLLDDERDSQCLLVDKQAVPLFVMVAEPFAMIRHDNDGRIVVQLMRLQVAH